MPKRRVPVTLEAISRLIEREGGTEKLKGEVESRKTVFYREDGSIAFEQEEFFHSASQYGMRSYFIYAEQYNREADG